MEKYIPSLNGDGSPGLGRLEGRPKREGDAQPGRLGTPFPHDKYFFPPSPHKDPIERIPQ
jgi:hypothetical protein